MAEHEQSGEPVMESVQVVVKGDPIPAGKYTVVACDIDTTGKRLIDEIVQIATYCPKGQFSQYVIPLMNLNPAARQRHHLRIVTSRFFRMLKDLHSYKIIKTKSEVAALNDFLAYLEKLREEDGGSQGVVLLYHENRKFVPYMIIEAMKKYNLLQRFFNTVKSFVNTQSIAIEKHGSSMKYFSLKQAVKALMNEEDEALFEGNASVRSKMVYSIAQHLARDKECKEENGDKDKSTEKEPEMSEEECAQKFQELCCTYGCTTDQEIKELEEQEKVIGRQSTLRPIFIEYFRTTLYHRVKAVTFRRVLAEHGHELTELHKIWEEGKKEALTKCLESCEELKETDREELVEILDHHFDPEKEAYRPIVRRRSSTGNPRSSPRRKSSSKNNDANNRGGTDKNGNKSNASNSPSKKKFFRNNRNRNNRAPRISN